MNRVEKARRASGMTQQAAAAVLEVSVPTYIKKEQNPKLLTFGELERLGREMDPVSRSLLGGAVQEVGAGVDDGRPLADVTLGEYFGLRSNDRMRAEFERSWGKFFDGAV